VDFFSPTLCASVEICLVTRSPACSAQMLLGNSRSISAIEPLTRKTAFSGWNVNELPYLPRGAPDVMFSIPTSITPGQFIKTPRFFLRLSSSGRSYEQLRQAMLLDPKADIQPRLGL